MEKKKLITSEEVDDTSKEEKPCYLVKVPPSVCKSEEVILFADKVMFEGGIVCFIVEDENEIDQPVLALTPGNIKFFYRVDPSDLSPLGIHRWQGVTGIRHIIDQEMVDKAVKRALYENTDFVEVMDYITDSLTKRDEVIAEKVITENVFPEAVKEVRETEKVTPTE